MKLDPRLIEVFHALMTVGTVTAAAGMLNTSQPSVSRSLKRLEEVTGMRLFARVSGGRLSPTAQAKLLFEEVGRSYAGLERIGQFAERVKHFHAGTISVVCAPVFAGDFIAQAVSRFGSRYEGVGITIDTQVSSVVATSMTAQHFDIGLAAYPMAPPATLAREFAEPDEVCVMRVDHPLAGRKELQLADLVDQRWIFMAGHDPYRHRVDGLFEHAGIERRFAVETPNSATLCAMVLEGVGIGIINPFTAIEYAGRGLAMRPLGVRIPFTTTLMTSAHRPRSPLIDRFVDALIAVRDSYLDRIDLKLRELGPL